METLILGGAQAPQVSFPPDGYMDCPVNGTGQNTALPPLQPPTLLVAAALLCCLNGSSASVNNLGLPKARGMNTITASAILCNTWHSHSIFPLGEPYIPLPFTSVWLQGTQGLHSAALLSPSTDHCDHYLTTDLLQHSSSPVKSGLHHFAGDPLPFPPWFSHKTISFFQTSLKLEQATLLQYYAHLAQLNKDEILKKEKSVSGPF